MKSELTHTISRYLLALLLMLAVDGSAWAATYTATVRKTYVDYNNPTTSMGEIASGTASISGYNKISGDQVTLGNTGWGANYITYVQVDASAIGNAEINSVTLTAWVTGSTDSKRRTTWGVGYNNSAWSSSMTYNSADRTITLVGEEATTATSSNSTWEQVTFDITEALAEDDDKVVTLIIYETAAGGGYFDVVSVQVDYSPYYNYTLKSSLNNVTLATGTAAEGSSVTVPYPRYQLSSGTLYQADKQSVNPHYGKTFTVASDNHVETITYTAKEGATNIATFREAEDFLTPADGNNYVYIRSSNTRGGYANGYTDVATLPAGAYKITAASYANSSTAFKFRAGETDLYTHTGSGGWSETTSDNVQVPQTGAVQVSGGSFNYALDYVYIQRIFAYQDASSGRTYTDSNKKPTLVAPTGTTITYSSSNTAVATVDGDGIDMHHNGTATITARATIDGVEYFTTHTVNVTGEPGATATFSPASPTDSETFTISGTGSLPETENGSWISVSFGSPLETQIVGTASGQSAAKSLDTNNNSWAYAPDGIPTMGTYYTFTPTVSGTLVLHGYMDASNGIRLVDAEGNVLEKISASSVTTGGWKEYTFNTLLVKGTTYYIYAETQWMADADDSSTHPTLFLNWFKFTQMEGTTISLINQSLLFTPNNNANSRRLDRTIPGFDITFGGKDGAKFQNNGTFILRNNVANSESDNGSITITPRIKTGSASGVTITGVKLNTGTELLGSPSVYINGVDRGAVTANSTLSYSGLTGNTLTIKLKGYNTTDKNKVSFILNSITFTYSLAEGTTLDDSKGTVDLKFANYVYGHTGETAACDLYFDSPMAFYGDVTLSGSGGSGFGEALTNAMTKHKNSDEKTHFNDGDTNTPYTVRIGEGVCILTATFAGNDYFAPSTATTRLYSYDYTEEPALTLVPGASYTVPSASGLIFALTATGGGSLTLTNTAQTTATADGNRMETTATAGYVTITNSSSADITITKIEVYRQQATLDFTYADCIGDDGNVMFPGESHSPTAFTIKEGDTDLSEKYEATGTYAITRAVSGVSLNASTGVLTVAEDAGQGWLEVTLTVNPKAAYQDQYGPISKTVRLYIVEGYWDFRTYKYYSGNAMNGSSGWSAQGAYSQIRDTEQFEDFIQNDGEPLMLAVGLETRYKMRMTWAKNNGPGRMHLFGKGSNDQNRARYDHGGILRIPVRKGMQIEINAYAEGMQSEMDLDGVNNLLNSGAVEHFYVDETSASQRFIANRDGYVDIINPSSNLGLFINYIRLTSDMVFYYGQETYTEPGGTFNNFVINQGETTLSYGKTADSGSGSDAICQSIATDGTVTQRVGAYGSYEVTVTGSGSGLLAGKTGTYKVYVIDFSVTSPVEKTIDATGKTTFTPKNDITIQNNSGLDNDALKSEVAYSFVSKEVSVAYFDGDDLVIEGTGDVVLQARLGAITRTMVYRVRGAALNEAAPVITNTQGSYTVVIQGGSNFAFDTSRMTSGILGDLSGTTPTYSQDGNRLTISGLPEGLGGTIPIYASCTYNSETIVLEGVLTVAYSSHVWNFESNLLPTLGNWTPKNAGSWSNACTFEEPVDASATGNDTKDWCFVRKMGVSHPESSIIYYYNHSVVGTNALVIPETSGLYLRTTQSGKQLGVEMDNERINNVGVPKLTDGAYACRNLMLLRGGQMVIPKVKPGQWIEVRWTRHQDDLAERVQMQNLVDVNGKYINEIYKIGNCFYNIPGQTSTYMFQVNPDATPSQLDADGCLDAVFEVADNVYISIQQIELHEPGWDYNSSMAPQLMAYVDGDETEIRQVSHQYVCDGNEHTLVFLPKDSQNAPNAPQVWTITLEGNLNAGTGASKSDGGDATASFTYKDGWGKAYVTLTSYSQNMKYVANQNTWIITIGAQPRQTYPHTWDFTKYFADTKASVGGADDDYYAEDPHYSDAAVYDKATDMTSSITNSTISGNANGWTISKPYSGNGPLKPSEDALEYWAGNASDRSKASFDYYQTLSVPNGYYIVSADMYNSLNDEAGAVFKPTCCLYANNGSFDERVIVDVEGTDFNTYSTPAIQVTNGTLRIGVKNFDSMAARWFVADNFRLTRIEHGTTSTRAHEGRCTVDSWTEAGDLEQTVTTGYDSRKYGSYFVDGAQLVSHTLGLLPETEGLGFSISDKSADHLTLDMQSTVSRPPTAITGSDGSSVVFPHTWRDGKLMLTAGSTIIVPKPGDDYASYYIYIRSSRKPASVSATEEVTDDVDAAQQQYKYHFTANADAVITFSADAEVYVLSVTNIFKTMHQIGGVAWATESRSHGIDHALTGHLTTNNADAFAVTYDSYDLNTATVALTAVDEDGYVPADDGIVLRQVSGVPATATYSVPLFTPAVTTAPSSTATDFGADNLMQAHVAEGQIYYEDVYGYTKFILTNVHWTWTYDQQAQTLTSDGPKAEDAAGFYRLHLYGDSRDVMAANTAYLCVPSDRLPVAIWNLPTSGARVSNSIAIRPTADGTTGIEEILQPSTADTDHVPHAEIWYTVDGVKLDGRPTKAGLYICNGRKVAVR
ncbi:MAG: hypothetical protein IJ544_00475 [Prevotella sp.]|nr:hypothetical protein [Prevotella sp.]